MLKILRLHEQELNLSVRGLEPHCTLTHYYRSFSNRLSAATSYLVEVRGVEPLSKTRGHNFLRAHTMLLGNASQVHRRTRLTVFSIEF